MFPSSLRPWQSNHELVEVRNIIYSTIISDPSDVSQVLVLQAHIPDRVSRFLYARDRILVWRRRAKNMNETAQLDNHLELMLTLLEIALQIEKKGDLSSLDKLCGMCLVAL